MLCTIYYTVYYLNIMYTYCIQQTAVHIITLGNWKPNRQYLHHSCTNFKFGLYVDGVLCNRASVWIMSNSRLTATGLQFKIYKNRTNCHNSFLQKLR